MILIKDFQKGIDFIHLGIKKTVPAKTGGYGFFIDTMKPQ